MTNRDLDYYCPNCDKYMFSLRGDTETNVIQEMNRSENRFCSENCKKEYAKKPGQPKVEIKETQLSKEYIAYFEKMQGRKINE